VPGNKIKEDIMEFVPFHDALFVMGNSTSKACMIIFEEVL
jgi:hypothetical protein